MKKTVIAVAVLCFVGVAIAEDGFNTSWSDGWRVTAGPQFDFRARGRLGVKASAIPVPASSTVGTKAAAQSAGSAIGAGSGRFDLPNGGYVDPNDAAGKEGETWNWHVPAGAADGGTMSFANSYAERTTSYAAFGGSVKDDASAVGVNLGLERTVWKRGSFGVDAGFGFAFFLKDDWFRSRAGGVSRTDVYKTGSYITDVSLGNEDVFSDPWAQNPDGSYGVGTHDGPGPVFSLDDVSVSHRWGSESVQSSTTAYGPFTIRGDMQMYEFQLALKPYYELTDWLMVRGTLGVGLDYRRFDVRASGLGGGSERDWDCYMVCGLGGMFHWKGICLGADFLRKVFADDMDVDTRCVKGGVESAAWTLRAYVGYEF